MPSFESLSTDDRWALALYAGHFAFSDAAAAEGERLWRQDASLHRLNSDLKTLVGATPAALADKIGQDKADSLMAYLRRHPDIVGQQSGSLSLVRLPPPALAVLSTDLPAPRLLLPRSGLERSDFVP